MGSHPLPTWWGLFIVLIVAGSSVLATSRFSPEVDRALQEALQDVTRTDRRIEVLGRLSYDPKASPELRAAALELFRAEAVSSPLALERLFPSAPPEMQTWILDLYRERWSSLGRGVSTWRREMVRLGLESPEAGVRQAAARLAALRPIPRIIHPMIDAAIEHPELEQAAILCLGANSDPRGLRWALEVAARRAGRWRESLLYAVSRMGGGARLRLLEALDGDDPTRARLALEGLLLVAGAEDLPRLHTWLNEHGATAPDLAARVRRTIAEIEAGARERVILKQPELLFDAPS